LQPLQRPGRDASMTPCGLGSEVQRLGKAPSCLFAYGRLGSGPGHLPVAGQHISQHNKQSGKARARPARAQTQSRRLLTRSQPADPSLAGPSANLTKWAYK
jgi:hypothetical protein